VTIPLANRPVRASLLLDPERTLACTGGGEEGIRLQLAGPAPDPIVSVIALEIEGEPAVIRPRIVAGPDGSLDLSATTAELLGESIQVETRYGDPNIGYWTRASDAVRWPVRLPAAGRYQAAMIAACPNDTAGATFQLRIGDASLNATVPGTGGYDQFAPHDLGAITLPAGDHDANLTVTRMPGGAVMNLQRITLTPLTD
jgi:alpha-L-fucosidase